MAEILVVCLLVIKGVCISIGAFVCLCLKQIHIHLLSLSQFSLILSSSARPIVTCIKYLLHATGPIQMGPIYPGTVIFIRIDISK